ncbi:MAG: hypothetical protein EBR82_59240 [Caulobacteraceae bacterium]|nr:hypothetical protein [Caulobacteraceae bacterium]
MDVALYTGNGSTKSISNLGFSPDFVWLKRRNLAASHNLFDIIRGATKFLGSDNTNAEQTGSDRLTSFDSAGFTLGANHGLGVAPKFIIMKSRTRSGGPWWVHHLSATDTTTKYLQLSTTSAVIDNGGSGSIWGAALPTSTLFGFSVGAGRAHTQNEDIVSYCFAPVVGYSNGFSYTGNGSTDGPMVYLGFRPKLIILKRTDTTGDWLMVDTSRSPY